MQQGKMFRELMEGSGRDATDAADLGLAAFVVAHGFRDKPISVGSIGLIPRREALVLNAILSPQASLVVLSGDPLSRQNEYIAGIVREIEASGFALRLQFADLTLPNRWPSILSAMAQSEIGVLGVDARWAATDNKFWSVLQEFMRGRKMLVYVRNMLDYRQADLILPFIRAMPQAASLSLVATTPGSVWFAGDSTHAAATRDLLRSSGLFPQNDPIESHASPTEPVVVSEATVLHLSDNAGRLPRVKINTSRDARGGIEYATGWASPEEDGCWTDGAEAVARITLPDRTSTPKTIAITGNAWIPPNAKDQLITVGLGHKPNYWTKLNFVEPEEIATMSIEVPDKVYDAAGVIVRVRVQTPGRPSDFGLSDTRLLGFKIRSVSVFT